MIQIQRRLLRQQVGRWDEYSRAVCRGKTRTRLLSVARRNDCSDSKVIDPFIPTQSGFSGLCHGKHFYQVRRRQQQLQQQRHQYFATLTKLSKRELADLEERIYRQIGTDVKDPIVKESIGASSLQWLHPRIAVSDDGTVQLLLKLPSLLHPSLSKLKETVRTEATDIIRTWLDDSSRTDITTITVNVEAMATKPVPMMTRYVEDPKELLDSIGPGLTNVNHIIAVYSCKGGVGKSTVAVNLAYEMSNTMPGSRIGIVDLDVYGPSLPVLVQPSDVTVRRSDLGKGMVYPLEHEGVKLLSLGFVNTNSGVPGSGQGNGAAVMRGPFAGKVVSQLLKGTDWGDLDVLILDLPPGTGDVQLQVLQDLSLTGAVAVTTPSKLASVDTKKGIEMFTSLGVPTLAVVENMSYFQCEGGGKHYPFGKGLLDDLNSDADETQKDNFGAISGGVIQLPISTSTNAANDNGQPLCLSRPVEAVEELDAFKRLAESVAGEMMKMQFGKNMNEEFVVFDSSSSNAQEGEDLFDISTMQLSLDKSNEQGFILRLFGESGAVQKRISAASLRARDPKTGEIIPDSPFKHQADDYSSITDPIVTVHKSTDKKSPSLSPVAVERKGLYGFAVRWADGATIIYSKRSIAVASGGTPK